MTKVDYTRGTPLRVFWVDSCHLPGWQYGDELTVDVERVVSLGFAATNATDEGLALSTSISQRGGYLAPLIVPWEAITHIQELPREWHRDENLLY